MPATFSVTRDEIIASSLRLLGQLGEGLTPSAEDYFNCAQSLNMMIKAWMTNGLQLWKVTDVMVALVAGQSVYTIGPTGDVISDRPLRIIQAFRRDNTINSLDIELSIWSRSEYMNIGNKLTPAAMPTAVYYQPTMGNGTLYVYPTPFTPLITGDIVHLIAHLPISDVVSAASVPEFPNEWFQCLKWGLAAEIGLEYGAPPRVMDRVDTKADMYYKAMENWGSAEEAISYFTLKVNHR